MNASLARLGRAMQWLGANGQAPCVMWSFALALDIGGDVVCATLPGVADRDRALFPPNASDVPFIHAWTEKGGHVYSPTLARQHGGALAPIDRDVYYRGNQPIELWRLGHRDVEALDRRLRFSAALKHGKRRAAGATVRAVLSAAGVRYRVVDGALLPLVTP